MKNSVDHSKLNSLPVVVRGTGSIGLRHLSVLKEVGAEPIAFPARRGEDRAELQQYITVNNFQAVADKQIAAAIVATDTAHHLADAIELIRAGCNVLIEKPLAASRDGLVELESAAAAHRREVFTGCCLRFHPGLQKFRQLLPQLGSVHHVRVECSSYLPDWRPSADYRRSYSASVEQGGVLRDLIHEIDYSVWLFGRPSTVFAQLNNFGRLEIECDETADLLWQVSGGPTVSIHLDYLTHHPRRMTVATGENGTIQWDAIEGRVTVRLLGLKDEHLDFPIERNTMYRDQASAFLRALDGERSPLLASLEEGAFAVALCDAARESSRLQRAVHIEDWRKAEIG